MPPSSFIVAWGDGTSSTYSTAGLVTHVYADGPATPTISVTLVDTDGTHPAAGVQGVKVVNVAPLASLNGPKSGFEGAIISLVGSATDPSSADTAAGFTYAWTVTKDGQPFCTGTGAGFSFTPDDNGAYLVTLTATDKDSGVSTPVSIAIAVANVVPTAIFHAPAVVDQNGTITLSLSDPSDPSSVDASAAFNYAFDFGSGYGSFATASSASAAADSSGVHPVRALRSRTRTAASRSMSVPYWFGSRPPCRPSPVSPPTAGRSRSQRPWPRAARTWRAS